MNALTIKDPADLLSFIGHTLGFWPQESLVCITLDKGKVGATLRIDLPRQSGTELPYARTVSSYLTIRVQAPHQAALQASQLWMGMLDSNDFPTDEDCTMLIANLQFPHIRDRLMADIPGIDEPPQHILFAQTQDAPKWSRIEWAQQLLLHAYTRTSPQHAAPILTTIGYINWWEGRGSRAHQYMQLALDTDPGYRFARLTDQMLGAGIIAGWNTNKNTAYKTDSTCPKTFCPYPNRFPNVLYGAVR